MARGFEPGIDFIAAVAARRGALGQQRGLRPELGQRGQALVVGQRGRARDVVTAQRRQLLAALALEADDAQRFLGRGAERAGREDVGAPLRQIIGRLQRTDLHAGAARQQGGGAQRRNQAPGAQGGEDHGE
ncbi:hypothetical protein D3C78_1397440 [compost metagenome]